MAYKSFFHIIIYLFILLFSIKVTAQYDINPNGYNVFYHDNGNKASEGFFREGKPDGYWKTYYPDGKIKSEGNRKDFLLDSTWIFYNEKGNKISEINYKNSKKNGFLITYNDSGFIVSKEYFINDKKEDYSYYYYPTGQLKLKIPFIDNKEEGLAFEFDKDSTIITLTEYKKGYVVKQEKINRKDKRGFKTGMHKTFYENGKVKTEVTYLDDKMHGYYKEYDFEGNLIKTLKYVNGELEKEVSELTPMEIFTEYYEDGKIKKQGGFKNNKPEGVHYEFDENGIPSASKIYKEGVLLGEGLIDSAGMKQGPWKEFYPDGTLKAEGKYEDNKRIGEWKFYHPNKKIEQIGKYAKGEKPDGVWKWYYDSGILLREENYRKGLRDGLMIEYSDSGTVITKGEFLDGEKEGFWFYEMGDHREEGNYKSGKMEGIWKFYYDNGKLSFEGNFIDDLPDGKHKYYWPNGKLKEEGKFIMGNKDGEWKSYTEDGYLYLVIYYKNGQELKYDGVKVKPEKVD
ncbi:MAG: toxin-antitoxin system YwqK family antitoxin [Bacteroidia bacterium]